MEVVVMEVVVMEVVVMEVVGGVVLGAGCSNTSQPLKVLRRHKSSTRRFTHH